ncbi:MULTISPECIES: MupA/Atu3671 family FMN-dependent luciferase-like monooxygenase [unclassified Streptomyces]|uniref:MupA/Atu3671 family FMN-dependent luciferase-like monooxygenase n=1 Tax=unclassified Streptomyces TaxID=2593676 RepID=UPI0033A1E8C8
MYDSVADLVTALAVRGVRLYMDKGRLQCHGPREALEAQTLAELRERRDEVTAFLQGDCLPFEGHPLSRGQQSLYLHQRLVPDSAAYNLALAARFEGPVNHAALDRALREVMARHPALRTTYAWGDAGPTQTTQEVPGRVIVEESASGVAAEHLVEEFMDRPFDLERDLPLRAMVVRTGPADEHPVVVLVIHHIAADLWSLEVVMDEWLALYEAGEQGRDALLAPTGPGFAERVGFEKAWLADPAVRSRLDYWRDRFDEEPQPLDLPFDRPRPAVQTFRGAGHSTGVGQDLSGRLAGLARTAGVTPNMLFLTAFQVLLHKFSALDDIVVGTPTAGRPSPREQRSVGFFADPALIRADLRGDPVFSDLLGGTRTALMEAVDHQVPFPAVVEHLDAPRDPQRSPLFQVMYVWEHAIGARRPVRLLSSSRQRGAAYDLILGVRRHDDGRFTCSWTYNTDLFERETVERIGRAFTALLEGIAQRPEARISSLPAMAAGDEEALRRFTRGPVVPTAGRGWLDEFDEQVRRTPQAVALVCGEESLTYRELGNRADRMAAAMRARGVGEEVRVGLCLERSLDLVVAMLAIAKAGGAYVPLDPSYPTDRLAYMLRDAQAFLCLADRRGQDALRSCETDARIVSLDELAAEASLLDPAPASPVADDALSYIIYTSGSTGRPKGVMVTRRNVTNLFSGIDLALSDGPHDPAEQPVWLAVTSVCFDISVLELLWTVCRGYKVVIETDLWTAQARSATPAGQGPTRPVDFSLFYFAAETAGRTGSEVYRLLTEGARFADENDLRAVWLPERHFHAFGGAYPNPSVLAGAVAAVTRRVQIRAGSVVLPLHDPLRVAEEWAMVDNLSNGRVGLSFASGWQPNDFVLAPHRFADRKEAMWQDMDVVRRLWRGEPVRRRNGVGAQTDVVTLPRPVQPELPVWATAAGSEETFRQAGAQGVNILTHLLGQNVRELARKIAVYREARTAAGHGRGTVTLMLHTFVHPDPEFVRTVVREPFKNYLRSSIDLMRGLAVERGLDPERHREAIVDQAFERYFGTSALFGTPESCAALVGELSSAGVDEIACLVDFGVDDDLVLKSLKHIGELDRSVRLPSPLPAGTPAQSVVSQRVTHLQCTPAFAQLLLLKDEEGSLAEHSLRQLLVGGDASPSGLGARLRGAGIPDVFNMYGPTETCVWSAVQRLDTDPEGPVTVGGPLANTSLYVLDQRLRPVPVGVPGELCIGGAGVSRGYWNRPALTAERFVPDPFAESGGARMYATGDIVRHLGDGRLEFLGRADHQVKVRGFRVEFGEIESVLGAHPDVAGCAVVTRTDRDGAVALVAFLVARDGAAYDEADVRAHARGLLPDYMMPSRMVVLPRIPFTLNGKVDRKELGRLAQRADDTNAAEAVAPRNEIEGALQGVWQELLERDGVGVHENFFEVGGHSLLAAKMQARIAALGIGSVELVDIFTYPTIAGLAAHLGRGPGTGPALGEHLQRRVNQQKSAARRQQRRRKAS